MNIQKITLALAFSAALFLCGCTTSDGNTYVPDRNNVAVSVREGASLKAVVIQAAARRGWMPAEAGPDVVRLTIVQRSNKVVVDVKILDNTHYSIRQVESNIPARKYEQWINNLQRTIAGLAVQ